MNLRALLAAICIMAINMAAANSQSVGVFPYGALTAKQISAWNYYVTSEAEAFGCIYGDDDRLRDEPEGLLRSLAKNEAIEPVRVTYRTLIKSGPNTRELLKRNMYVASVECNQVYYSGRSLIGLPTIPFEEALTILHDDYFVYKSDDRIHSLLRSFQVANIDPRWFWSFFLADKAHLDMLGYDFETLLEIERILVGAEKTDDENPKSFALLHRIFSKLNHSRPAFYSLSGKCNKDPAEPSMDVIVWKDITDEHIKSFYKHHDLEHRGKWRLKLKAKDGGATFIDERPLDNPDNPYFNVTRGLTLYSEECQS